MTILAKGTSAPPQPIIVYDMDGVLWPIDERVSARIGARREDCDEYNFHQNPKLSPEQQAEATRLFSDPEFFREIEFRPGASEILRVEELGARVMIVSNSLNQQVADMKYPQLLAAVPGLKEENIVFNVLNQAHDAPKELDEQTLILVEDSPQNVARSPARKNIILRLPWNETPKAAQVMARKSVIWCNGPIAVNETVYHLTEHYLRRWAK